MRSSTWTALSCLLAGLFCGLGAVQGSQVDLFGPSIRSVGLAGAGTALEDGAAPVTTNTAALGLAESDLFRVHYLGGRIHLAPVEGVRRLDGSPDPMPKVTVQPHVISLELAKTLGPWLRAGVNIALPLPWLYFHETKDPWVPYSMRWQNRVARGMGTAGLSVRLPVRGAPRVGGVLLDDALQGGLWLGASVSLRPRGIIEVDLDITGLEPVEGEVPQVSAVLGDVDLAARYVLRPQVGLLLDFGTFSRKLEGLRFGASWSAASTTEIAPIRLDVKVRDLENVDPVFALVDLIRAQVWLGLVDFYDPHQVRLSLALERSRFALTADVQVNLWSELDPSYGRVVPGQEGEEARLVIDFSFEEEAQEYPAISGRSLDSSQFRDTVDLALGGEVRPPGWALPRGDGLLELAVRAGFRWQQGIARPTAGPSGFIDGDVLTGSLGLGLSVPLPEGGVVSGPLRLDWGLQVLRLLPVELAGPGPESSGLALPVAWESDAHWPGGWVVASGLSLGLGF